jgi:hypothetical protein
VGGGVSDEREEHVSETKVEIVRLEQLAHEVKTLWYMHQLGMLMFNEVLVEVNARRQELGYPLLTDWQVVEIKTSMERRGTL